MRAQQFLSVTQGHKTTRPAHHRTYEICAVILSPPLHILLQIQNGHLVDILGFGVLGHESG